jgi:hypothetical protein
MRLRLSIVLLITLITLQVGGIWSIYSTALLLHKQSKCIRLADSNQWIEFGLTTEEFQLSTVEDGELLIDGQFYDVVDTSRIGNLVHVRVVRDAAEYKLTVIVKGVQQQNHGWSAVAKYASSLSISPYLIPCGISINFTPNWIAVKHLFHLQDPVSTAHLLSIEYPPVG